MLRYALSNLHTFLTLLCFVSIPLPFYMIIYSMLCLSSFLIQLNFVKTDFVFFTSQLANFPPLQFQTFIFSLLSKFLFHFIHPNKSDRKILGGHLLTRDRSLTYFLIFSNIVAVCLSILLFETRYYSACTSRTFSLMPALVPVIYRSVLVVTK